MAADKIAHTVGRISISCKIVGAGNIYQEIEQDQYRADDDIDISSCSHTSNVNSSAYTSKIGIYLSATEE